MFILPYVYHRRLLPHMTVYEISILTQGGTELWEEEDGLSLTEDILGPNELHACSYDTYKDVTFCHINESELNMDEYYHWKDTTTVPEKGLFCWRPFYLFVSPVSPVSPVPALWLPIPETEHLGSYSCHELLTEWLTLHHKPDSPYTS